MRTVPENFPWPLFLNLTILKARLKLFSVNLFQAIERPITKHMHNITKRLIFCAISRNQFQSWYKLKRQTERKVIWRWLFLSDCTWLRSGRLTFIDWLHIVGIQTYSLFTTEVTFVLYCCNPIKVLGDRVLWKRV